MEVDAALQDSVERLMRQADFPRVLAYISGRRNLYLQSLTIANPESVSLVAQAQGMVKAMDEILRLPEDAANAKRNRHG